MIRGLAVFDVEGVILPRKRMLILRLSRFLGLRKTLTIIIIGLLYEAGVLSIEKAIKYAFNLFKGVKIGVFLEAYRELPRPRHVREAVEALRSRGFYTVLISSGVPQEIVDLLVREYGFDEGYGVKTRLGRGGEIIGVEESMSVFRNGKLRLVKEIMSRLGVSKDETVVIGDDHNNLQLQGICRVFIAFNAEKSVAAKADYVVESDSLLDAVAPIIGVRQQRFDANLLVRKTIHLASLLLVPSVFLFGRQAVATLLILTAAIFTLEEYLRVNGVLMPVVSGIVRIAGRKSELLGVSTAPLWLALGVTTVLLLCKTGFVAGLIVVALGDGLSGLIGCVLPIGPSFPFNRAKKVLSETLGFAAAWAVLLLYTDPLTAILCVTVGLIIDVWLTVMDDNLAIPVVVAFTYELVKKGLLS